MEVSLTLAYFSRFSVETPLPQSLPETPHRPIRWGGGSSNMAGIIWSDLVQIGLTDIPKLGVAHAPPPPSSLITGTPMHMCDAATAGKAGS